MTADRLARQARAVERWLREDVESWGGGGPLTEAELAAARERRASAASDAPADASPSGVPSVLLDSGLFDYLRRRDRFVAALVAASAGESILAGSAHLFAPQSTKHSDDRDALASRLDLEIWSPGPGEAGRSKRFLELRGGFPDQSLFFAAAVLRGAREIYTSDPPAFETFRRTLGLDEFAGLYRSIAIVDVVDERPPPSPIDPYWNDGIQY